MRGKRMARLIMLLLAVLLLGQSVEPVFADDCAALQKRVDDLNKEAQLLEAQLNTKEGALDFYQRQMLKLLEQASQMQAEMKDLPERARNQIIDRFGTDALKTIGVSLGIAVVTCLTFPALIPEGILASVEGTIDTIHGVHTAAELYEILRAQQEVLADLNERSAILAGKLEEARDFAYEYNLTDLQQLIRDEDEFPGLLKDLSQVWQDWLETGLAVQTLREQLDAKRAELQAAANELDACVRQDVQPCGTLAPGVLGQCR